jgi:hypothetical protein
VSVETAKISTQSSLNFASSSAKSFNSVGHTKVKSAG